MSIQQAFALALQQHQAGRLAEAEGLYRQILAVQPQHAGALHLLGVAASQAGRNDVAVGLIQQAIALVPNEAPFHYNLGYAWKELGRLAEAGAAYTRATELQPNYAEAHNNLGNVLKEQGRVVAAMAAFQRAVELRPSYAEAHNNLGNMLRDQSRWEEAAAAYRQALHHQPGYTAVYHNLGVLLADQGRFGEAIELYRRAVQLDPQQAQPWFSLGVALTELDRLDEAVAAFGEGMRRQPDDADGHYNFGIALGKQGRLIAAVAEYRRALELRPNLLQAYDNLGNALKDLGELDHALAAYRHGLALDPAAAQTHSNLLLSLHYLPELTGEALFREHTHWDEVHGRPLARFIEPHSNDPNPARRLRIGYVSGDFREHSAAYFLEELLAHHHADAVELFAYDQLPSQGPMAARFRRYVPHWRKIRGSSDTEVCRLIRQDGIDILIDLAGHTAGNRLPVFARKPAPIQVSWLGYCDTTGLRTMDYRFTDACADPPGAADALQTERLVRLPDIFACYHPHENLPEPNPLPASDSGRFTFASFHALPKLNAGLLARWAEILRRVPNSKLMAVATGLDEAPVRQRLLDIFAGRGIGPERLTLRGRLNLGPYFAAHRDVDLLLDSHPYSGHTVGCHALWMGVPVITLAGDRHCSRMMASVLSTLGLTELIGKDADDYTAIAVRTATNLDRLAEWRRTLRARMQASPLMDGARFAHNVEQAYREMWRTWCARPL